MTTETSRATFEKLAGLCDTMERFVTETDASAAFTAWDEANVLTKNKNLSGYEMAITYAFDDFDSFMWQREHMNRHRDEWDYKRWHLEQIELEKLARSTSAQQYLIRNIYGMSEDTVHDDLVLWRRYIDLYHEVAGVRIRRAS